MSYITTIQTHQIGILHIDTALFQHPSLIGDIRSVLLQSGLFTIELRETAALHFIDSPAIAILAQNVYCTVVILKTERGLADNSCTVSHLLLCLLNHGTQVKTAILPLSSNFHERAEQAHSQVAYLIALLKACFHSSIYSSLIWFVGFQPECFLTLVI